MKLKNVLIVIIIFIVIILTGVILSKNSKNENYTLEQINNIEYMVFKSDNKYGVINKNGEKVVEAVYDEIDIPNPTKSVFICKYDYNQEKQEYNIKVLNDKKEQILYQYFIIEAINLDWDTSETPYEKSVLKYKKNGKYGLIDFDGNIILKAKYDNIESLDFQEGLLIVEKNGKNGVINIKGDYILKEKYDIIKANEFYKASNEIENTGFIVGNLTSNGYKYGYVNYKNQKILNIEYDQIEILNNIEEGNTYFIAFKDGKAGLYSNKYNILKNVYDDIIYNEYNNCLIIENNGKQGVFKINGEMLLPIEYDNIFISGRYINTRKENNVEVFDYTNMDKISIQDVIGLNETIDNDRYIIAITSDEKYKIVDVVNKKIKDEEYDYLEYIENDEFIAYKEEKFGIVDVNGKIIVEFKYDDLQRVPNEHLIKGTEKNKDKLEIKYLDYNGNIVEKSNLDELYPQEIGKYTKVDLGYGQPYYIKK